jgi:hypothetical protein
LRAAFGAQGVDDIGTLADPVVLEQVKKLRALSKSPEFLESYHNFSGDYEAGSTMQAARTAKQEFNVVSGELTRQTLPSLNMVLGDFPRECGTDRRSFKNELSNHLKLHTQLPRKLAAYVATIKIGSGKRL